MNEKIRWIEEKIETREDLRRRCNVWRAAGKRIVFTNGCFDILHTGHLNYLARAASLGNKLVVGVNSSASVSRLKGPQRPLNTEANRAFALAALLLVDAVCIFEEDTPLELIQTLRPQVLTKGGDYTPDTIVGASFVEAAGGQVAVIPFVEGYSTTGLIAKIQGL